VTLVIEGEHEGVVKSGVRCSERGWGRGWFGEDGTSSRGGIYRESQVAWSQPRREDRGSMGIDAARVCDHVAGPWRVTELRGTKGEKHHGRGENPTEGPGRALTTVGTTGAG